MEQKTAVMITSLQYPYGTCSNCKATLFKGEGLSVRYCWKCRRKIVGIKTMQKDDYMAFTIKLETDRREMMKQK